MTFEQYELTNFGQVRSEELRELFADALKHIERICLKGKVNGRELALVRTKLEEASFYAQRACAKAYTL